jgi:RNA-directed DNA polymerase
MQWFSLSGFMGSMDYSFSEYPVTIRNHPFCNHMAASHNLCERLPDTVEGTPDQAPGLGSPTYPRLRLLTTWRKDGRSFARWGPRSQRLLSLALSTLRDQLKNALTPHCRHVKGRRGLKGAVRELARRAGAFHFVGRFDIASYYNSMQHETIMGLLDKARVDETLQSLVRQYLTLPDLNHTSRGMVAGGSLSPLLGALYLLPLDAAMHRHVISGRIHYVRYMDDIIILAKTRWHLRAAIRSIYEAIEPLGLRLHQEKRFIGRIDKGFDFLGYQIHPSRRLRPSAESLRRLVVRAGRLYEQGDDTDRLWQYITRWTRWLWGALDGLVSRKGGVKRYWVHVLIKLRISGITMPQA